MDLHYFANSDCLAAVFKEKILFVQNGAVKQLPLNDGLSTGIDCSSFDESGSRLAISSKRNIVVIDVPSGECKTIGIERNCSTLSWSASGKVLIAGDKSGGIWAINMEDNLKDGVQPKLISSRVAVVLALSLCEFENNSFIAVGDRDGRLSIFHYPATHNLHQVCLGHSQYIAALEVPDVDKLPNYLLSLGGDGIVNLWNIIDGDLEASIKLLDENDFLLAKNRPKSLLKIKSQGQTYSWLVFGEDSAVIHAFCLEMNASKLQLKVKHASDYIEENLQCENTIAGYACIASSLLAIVRNTDGKSCWPWELHKLVNVDAISDSFSDALTSYFSANNSMLSLRASRTWLERHPHHSTAEYEKRKKARLLKQGISTRKELDSADVNDAIDSDSDDGDE